MCTGVVYHIHPCLGAKFVIFLFFTPVFCRGPPVFDGFLLPLTEARVLASTSLVMVAPAAMAATAATAVPSLLTGDAPREALVAPLEERGWSVNEAALRTVLSDAQGYPFFLQLWGRALWEAGVSLKARRLDEAVVEMAGEAVNERRAIFYKDRCRELESRLSPSMDADRVLGAATAVAQTWLDGGKTPLTTGQLKQCLNDCGVDSDSRKALETLFEHSGFLVDLGNSKWGPWHSFLGQLCM